MDNMTIVELSDVENVLNQYKSIDQETKEKILTELGEISQTLKNNILEDTTSSNIESNTEEQTLEEKEQIQEEQIQEEKEPKEKIKKVWGVLVSDPNGDITSEYQAYVYQIPEQDEFKSVTDEIIQIAGEFNRSKKGLKHPVKTIGEALMYIPNKLFKEHNIFIKNKEGVWINKTDNTLTSLNA